MKRGVKLGTRRSPERIFLETLQIGDFFYSHKNDKDVTALASVCARKIRTEILIAIHPRTLQAERLVKVIIISDLSQLTAEMTTVSP